MFPELSLTTFLFLRIIRAHKIDYSSIVLNSSYENLPGVEYYTVEVDGSTIKFAQHDKAVLPKMLEELVTSQ